MTVKKRVETDKGLFIIGTRNGSSFSINFLPKGKKGVHVGRKFFTSVEVAEAYALLLDVNGFSVFDL